MAIEIKSINTQTPATKNQITNNKPDVIKSSNVLQGYLANSFNGGMLKPIAYAPIMAGTQMAEYRLRANLRMITPKTPVYQKLKATFKLYFVPNSRVWKNWEKFLAQKGGATETKITEVPNIGGINLPVLTIGYELDGTQNTEITGTILTDTDLWRDSWVSSYIPRFQTGLNSSTGYRTLPKYSLLPARGFKAIYNDFERNKEYDEPLTEYTEDDNGASETQEIIDNIVSIGVNGIKQSIIRGKRQNSYYTDYRTELLGEEPTEPDGTGAQQLVDLTEYEKKVSEYRSQSENSQKNDWDIIAEIRGSKKLTEGKVQLLGVQTVGLNYVPVNQTTYNANEEITEEFQVLGQQGAYAYTEIDIPLAQMIDFKEDGYLHVLVQVSADSVFETGFERTGLNVRAMDMYRPDLIELKNDVLYNIEKCGTRYEETEELTRATGFKRKFSEYFKAPNCLGGDLMTAGYYKVHMKEEDLQVGIALNDISEKIRTETKRSFQFFEQDDKETARYQTKKIWKDYTDILINENQAIMQEVQEMDDLGNSGVLLVRGDNQIFMLGMQTIVANLPIDDKIKNNYTMWGEE